MAIDALKLRPDASRFVHRSEGDPMGPENVHVSCERCGEQVVASTDMVLVITETEQLAYSFRCERCGDLMVRSGDGTLADRLREAGATPQPAELAGSVLEPAPFTMDDVVSFAHELRAEDHVVRLVLGS